jgi:ppGpp synthetase/RelA/SpoT-type nucleotidyltranferase
MTLPTLSPEQTEEVDQLVKVYVADRDRYQILLNGLKTLAESRPLADFIHSSKARLKDPDHLRDKLTRKWRKALGGEGVWDIDKNNLFERINDLAGLRLIHLHTRQLELINAHLLDALEEISMPLVQRFARTWDDENRSYFRGLGIETEDSESMYTSVHYIVEANWRTKRTCEIQVRTLSEELWGEVDHSINYPYPSPKMTCREQLRVLARATSTCTRLVDSIFAAHAEPMSWIQPETKDEAKQLS